MIRQYINCVMSEKPNLLRKIKEVAFNAKYAMHMRQSFQRALRKFSHLIAHANGKNEVDKGKRDFLLGSFGSTLLFAAKSGVKDLPHPQVLLGSLSEEQLYLIQDLFEGNAILGQDSLFLFLQDLLESGDYNIWKQLERIKSKIKEGLNSGSRDDLAEIVSHDIYGSVLDSMKLAFRYMSADLSVLEQTEENPAFKELVRHIFDGVNLSDAQIRQMSQLKSLANINENRLRPEVTELLELIMEAFYDFEPRTDTGRELQAFLLETLDFVCHDDEAEDYREWLRLNEKKNVLSDMKNFVLKAKFTQGVQATQDDLKRLEEEGVRTIKLSSDAILTNHYPSARNFVRSALGKGVKRFTLVAANQNGAQSHNADVSKYVEFKDGFDKVWSEAKGGFVRVELFY